jgi:hypothetical protein
MPGTVITISPRVPVAKLEKIARGRVQRDGVAELAASTADARQVAYLRRVARLLAADESLECHWAARTDGATYLTVFMAGRHDAGWMGAAKTGGPDEDPDGDYWSVPKPSTS